MKIDLTPQENTLKLQGESSLILTKNQIKFSTLHKLVEDKGDDNL